MWAWEDSTENNELDNVSEESLTSESVDEGSLSDKAVIEELDSNEVHKVSSESDSLLGRFMDDGSDDSSEDFEEPDVSNSLDPEDSIDIEENNSGSVSDYFDDFFEEEVDVESQVEKVFQSQYPVDELEKRSVYKKLDKEIDEENKWLNTRTKGEVDLHKVPKLDTGVKSVTVKDEADVDNPMVNKKTKSIVIDESGFTLADYFAAKRSKYGSKSVSRKKKIKDIIDEGLSDGSNPYTRRLSKKTKYQESFKGRVDKFNTGNKFLGKNSKIKSAEMRVAKRLGLTKEELSTIMGDKNLSELDKANMLNSVRHGSTVATSKTGKKGGRSVGDREILEYLALVEYATISNITMVVEKKYSTVLGHLNKLTKNGLVETLLLLNSPNIYHLTKTGAALMGVDNWKSSKNIKASTLTERLAINHIMGMLYNNSQNVLLSPDYPYRAVAEDGTQLRGEELVTEGVIFSSLSKVRVEEQGGFGKKEAFKGATHKRLAERWESAWRRWEVSKTGKSPELEEGNEYLYALFYDPGYLSIKYALPDIVVKRPRNSGGRSQNIAVEVERVDTRGIAYYRSKLEMYKLDLEKGRVYGKLVYVVLNKSIARKILKAAEKLNISVGPNGMLEVVPFIDSEGNPTKVDSYWL